HEVVTGQFPVQLSFKPLPGFVILAGWTVTVAAGTEDDLRLATLPAGVDINAADCSATVTNFLDYFPVIRRN
ncbi:MAG: hypothetical protein Q7J06_01760, partial [Bacteroidales bacterium]|nr:hypothetical protein [Bacteroidales bacterium]